jgi:hypothetical protein
MCDYVSRPLSMNSPQRSERTPDVKRDEPRPSIDQRNSAEQVPCRLGGPRPGRVGGDPGKEHLAGGDVDEEQQVEAAQGCSVDGREVTGDGCLGAQELGPGHRGAVWGRVDAVTLEDAPDGGCSDTVTEAAEFA